MGILEDPNCPRQGACVGRAARSLATGNLPSQLYDRDANPHVQRMPGHSKGVDPW